jgi:hypothetical protein
LGRRLSVGRSCLAFTPGASGFMPEASGPLGNGRRAIESDHTGPLLSDESLLTTQFLDTPPDILGLGVPFQQPALRPTGSVKNRPLSLPTAPAGIERMLTPAAVACLESVFPTGVQLVSLLQRAPSLLYLSAEGNIKPKVAELRAIFDDEAVAHLINQAPEVLYMDVRRTVGETPVVTVIVFSSPRGLRAWLTQVEVKLEQLREMLPGGLDVKGVLSRVPRLLTVDLDRTARRSVTVLRQMLTDAHALCLIEDAPQLLCEVEERRLRSRLHTLLKAFLAPGLVQRLVAGYPKLLTGEHLNVMALARASHLARHVRCSEHVLLGLLRDDSPIVMAHYGLGRFYGRIKFLSQSQSQGPGQQGGNGNNLIPEATWEKALALTASSFIKAHPGYTDFLATELQRYCAYTSKAAGAAALDDLRAVGEAVAKHRNGQLSDPEECLLESKWYARYVRETITAGLA